MYEHDAALDTSREFNVLEMLYHGETRKLYQVLTSHDKVFIIHIFFLKKLYFLNNFIYNFQ